MTIHSEIPSTYIEIRKIHINETMTIHSEIPSTFI